MPVSILTSIEQLSNEDIAMLSYENQKNFFKSIEWFSCLTKSTHEDDVSVKLYIVSSGNDPLQKCYLFCYIDKKRRKLSSLSNFYTMEFSVIFSLPQCQKKELLHELSSYIAKEIPANNFIKIQCLYDGIEETNLLYEAFCSSNYLARLHFFKENYFVNVRKKSFNDYYELRPSALTNTIRRKK